MDTRTIDSVSLVVYDNPGILHNRSESNFLSSRAEVENGSTFSHAINVPWQDKLQIFAWRADLASGRCSAITLTLTLITAYQESSLRRRGVPRVSPILLGRLFWSRRESCSRTKEDRYRLFGSSV